MLYVHPMYVVFCNSCFHLLWSGLPLHPLSISTSSFTFTQFQQCWGCSCTKAMNDCFPLILIINRHISFFFWCVQFSWHNSIFWFCNSSTSQMKVCHASANKLPSVDLSMAGPSYSEKSSLSPWGCGSLNKKKSNTHHRDTASTLLCAFSEIFLIKHAKLYLHPMRAQLCRSNSMPHVCMM